MKKKISIVIAVILVVFLVGFLDNMVNFIINIKWFNEVGYTSVFLTKIIATLKLMIPIFLISYIGIWVYYKSLRKSITAFRRVSIVNAEKEKLEKRIFIISNLVVSFFISFSFASTYWYRILQFTNSVSFHKKDPIFHLDISFYVFKLPLIESLYGVLMTLLVLLIVVTFVTYFILSFKGKILTGDLPTSIRGINIKNSGIRKFAGKQLAVVSSLIILLLSVGYVIKSLKLVYSTRGVVFGGGYTDVNITLLFYKIIIVACVISAVVIFASVLAGKIKPIIVSICLIFGLMILNGAVSAIAQNLYVKSNEKNLETKYIKYNIDFTRSAFNLKNVTEKPFNVANDLTKDDLNANKDTINNIKVNSYAQALEFYNQTQVIKYYYKFNDLDVDRYNINGKGTQVFVAPREIDVSALDQKSSTWSNKHLVYTHGYGVAMSKVSSVTSEGKPDFVIKDIPPANATDIKITEPRIYFGEKIKDYAVVDNTLHEFDYPKGAGNQTSDYNGTAGIKMTGINKLLFAINEREMSFLLSGNITSKSKIIINRNVMDRVNKIAPFLTYDKDPYAVISNGKIYWIIDAYTTSDRYPYSQPDSNGDNYMRNSIKVVMDAVNGTTNFYIVDNTDPIAKSYSKIFPDLFKSADKIPADIKQHFRYPEDMFKIQCNMMGKYHVTDSGVFYNGDDLWQIAQNQKQVGGEKIANETSYVYMKLPGETKEEMVLIDYFNVRNKDLMISLFGARMDAENYGKLVMYRFPSTTSLSSPYQFKQLLNQDTTISSQLSLWNKEGSQVLFGDTIILPIKNSLIYIEPIYLRANGTSSIPEIKRVVVNYGDKTVLAENIDSALTQIFNTDFNSNTIIPSTVTPGTTKPSTTPATTGIDSTKLKQANDLYQKALDAQKTGDWAKYGDYINQLGKLLGDLSK